MSKTVAIVLQLKKSDATNDIIFLSSDFQYTAIYSSSFSALFIKIAFDKNSRDIPAEKEIY